MTESPIRDRFLFCQSGLTIWQFCGIGTEFDIIYYAIPQKVSSLSHSGGKSSPKHIRSKIVTAIGPSRISPDPSPPSRGGKMPITVIYILPQ